MAIFTLSRPEEEEKSRRTPWRAPGLWESKLAKQRLEVLHVVNELAGMIVDLTFESDTAIQAVSSAAHSRSFLKPFNRHRRRL